MSAVLIVEDRENVRRSLRGGLIDAGLKVIEAGSKDSAISLFQRNAGIISGVITDLRLVDDADENDVSGLEVGREFKRHNPRMPIFCNSAFTVSRRVADSSPFDRVFKKGSPDESLADNMEFVKEQILNFEASRFSEIPDQLNKIRTKYGITDEDFMHLVSVSPISAKVQTALTLAHELSDGGDLEDSLEGVSRLFVLPENTAIGEEGKLLRPLPIIHKYADGTHIAEVFGLPCIYAYGDSYLEAQTGLLTSLSSYKEQLSEPEDSVDADMLVRFKMFLSEVIW